MKTDAMLINLVRILQTTLSCFIGSGYFIACLTSVVLEVSIVKFYLIGTAGIYYAILLIRSPGSIFDVNDSSVKGICIKCDRLRGKETSHCTICNKCYNRRDHHCVLIGKCIAANNLKDFFYCILFTFFYFVAQLCTQAHKMLLSLLVFTLGVSVVWFGTVITTGALSQELMDKEKWSPKAKDIKKIYYAFKDKPQNILFPLLRLQTTLDC